MKKIVFLNPYMGYPVPSTMGGGVEELLTNLLIENEKTDGEFKFFFVQKQLYGKDKKFSPNDTFKNSEIVKVKYNTLLTFFQRAINKCLKFLKIKKDFPTYFPIHYHNQAFKTIKKINPDLIIYESQIDANARKYVRYFGKEKMCLHMHIQDLEKTDVSKYVNNFIGVSDFVIKDYKNFLKDKNDINYFLLKNCVNEERFNKTLTNEQKLELKKSLGYNENDFIVVYCGRICQEKGVNELCEAILKTPDNIKLLIIGSLSSAKKQTSPYLNKIANIAKQYPNKFKFTGYVKNTDLYKYYNIANLQVVPSLWEEAAGLVVTEGQMCGLPQIITKSGGMIEFASKDGTIIVERDENLIENLSQQIIQLSNDKQVLANMSKSSKNDSQKYNKETYYRNFVEIVNKIFGETL